MRTTTTTTFTTGVLFKKALFHIVLLCHAPFILCVGVHVYLIFLHCGFVEYVYIPHMDCKELKVRTQIRVFACRHSQKDRNRCDAEKKNIYFVGCNIFFVPVRSSQQTPPPHRPLHLRTQVFHLQRGGDSPLRSRVGREVQRKGAGVDPRHRQPQVQTAHPQY